MRAISLFSGVGGFELGFQRAGIETVLQAERDPWCREVLARHWPEVRRVDDVRTVGGWAAPAGLDRGATGCGPHAGAFQQCPHGTSRTEGVDLIFGGFPCQPFSVAGKRAADRDERNLWPEFRRIVSDLRPRWVVAENVPGLLSIHGGRFFGATLTDLADCGFAGVAYAVLDAQHFGVPQRRRRVFIVAGPSRAAVEAVLAICESCGGHPTAGRATGQGLAYSLAASVRGTGDGHGNAWNTTYVTNDLADSLTVGANQTMGFSGDYVAAVGLADSQRGEVLLTETSHQLTTGGGKPGQGYGAVLVGRCLTASNERQDPTVENLVAYTNRGAVTGGCTETLRATSHGAIPMHGVRRLTPLECERLMGWGDEHTRWTADGREVPDSIRYRMCGNGVVSTVAEWIGRRIVQVDGGR